MNFECLAPKISIDPLRFQSNFLQVTQKFFIQLSQSHKSYFIIHLWLTSHYPNILLNIIHLLYISFNISYSTITYSCPSICHVTDLNKRNLNGTKLGRIKGRVLMNFRHSKFWIFFKDAEENSFKITPRTLIKSDSILFHHKQKN